MFNKLKKLHKLWTQHIEPYKDIVGLIMGAAGSYCAKISFNMKPFYYFLIFWIIFLITPLFRRLKKDSNDKNIQEDNNTTKIKEIAESKLSNNEIAFLLNGFWSGDCFVYKTPSPRGILKRTDCGIFFKEPSYPALVGWFENLTLNKDNNYFFQQTLLARAPHNSKVWIRFVLEDRDIENIEITIYDGDKQEKTCLPNHLTEVILDKDSNFHFMIRGKKELSLLGVKIEIIKWQKL